MNFWSIGNIGKKTIQIIDCTNALIPFEQKNIWVNDYIFRYNFESQ